MITYNKRISTIVVAAVIMAAIMMTPLLQTTSARSSNNGPIVIPFTKWAIPGSSTVFTGFVNDDPTAPFEGYVFQNVAIPLIPAQDPPLPAVFRHFEARYDVIGKDPRHSFSTLIHGKATVLAPAEGVLDGVITEGWHRGSEVHVEFGTFTCTYTTTACFIGTITILPDNDKDKDNDGDGDRHGNGH